MRENCFYEVRRDEPGGVNKVRSDIERERVLCSLGHNWVIAGSCRIAGTGFFDEILSSVDSRIAVKLNDSNLRALLQMERTHATFHN